jgi:hypothetical protein
MQKENYRYFKNSFYLFLKNNIKIKINYSHLYGKFVENLAYAYLNILGEIYETETTSIYLILASLVIGSCTASGNVSRRKNKKIIKNKKKIKKNKK